MPKVIWDNQPNPNNHTGRVPYTTAWRGYTKGKWIATIKLTPAGKYRRHWRERFWRCLPTVEARDSVSFDTLEEAKADVQTWVDDFWLPDGTFRVLRWCDE